MFRGVNKNIIEITQTDSQYFEKVILFVRQSHREKDSAELEKQAEEYIKAMAEDMTKPTPALGSAVGTKERVNLKGILLKLGMGLAVVAMGALVVFM